MPGADSAVEANGTVGARDAVEAERSDPGVDKRRRAVSSGSGAMDALPRAHNLMRMDDGDVDEKD